jgi:aspartate aminotransferase, mitochondrial
VSNISFTFAVNATSSSDSLSIPTGSITASLVLVLVLVLILLLPEYYINRNRRRTFLPTSLPNYNIFKQKKYNRQCHVSTTDEGYAGKFYCTNYLYCITSFGKTNHTNTIAPRGGGGGGGSSTGNSDWNRNDSTSQLSMSSSQSTSTSSSTETASSSSSAVSSSSSSWWDHVPMGEADSILGIAQAFRECINPNKVNICVGAYRTSAGIPYILPSVQSVETVLLQQQLTTPNLINKEYLPIDGDNDFIKVAIQFAYGTTLVQQFPYIAAVQTLSGTGACRIGGHFLQQFMKYNNNIDNNNDNDNESSQSPPTIYIPNPTWGNHWKIFKECGLETKAYRYYDSSKNQLDLTGLLEDINNAPNHSIILLHVCAHNPTGCDPSKDQWEFIGNTLALKQHICFFDSAYQGFASGNAEDDAYALRYIVQRKDIPVILAQSFAKNFGLYGERVGTLSVVCSNQNEKEHVISQLKNIIRPMYSSPPKHGSNIVKTILMNTTLTEQYYNECRGMANRILCMRQLLVETLYKMGSQHDWSHVIQQIGMFAYTGMNSNMCDGLTEEYAIYLTRDGRISLAGLNEDNIEYVANAIHAVTKNQSITSSTS